MITFAYPDRLWLLLLIPVGVALFIFSRIIRNRRLDKLGQRKALQELMPTLSSYKPAVRLVLSMIALTAIIIAFARPWGGIKNQSTTKQGIEIVIAVDASNSMLASATGEEMGLDRMKTSKLLLEKLINRLHNDRVGLIAYAGDAYTLIPVTNDYVSAKAFLNSIDPSMIPHQGTNIGAALNMAINSFSENGDVGKAIILLTDAEELENVEGTLAEVKKATKRGIQVDVIGIGATPVTIPSEETGRMIDSETGQVVYTSLNEDLAVAMAKEGKGIYVNASNEDAIEELVKQLDKLQKSSMESSFMVTHDELYFPFVIIAIGLLLVDFVLTDKRNRWLDKMSLFHKGTAHLVIAVILLPLGLQNCSKEGEDAKPTENNVNRDSLQMVYSFPKERELTLMGNDLHHSLDFERADSSYRAALAENPKSVVANLNSGVNNIRTIVFMESQTEEGQLPDSIMGPMLQQASAYFSNAALPHIKKSDVSQLAFYNLGNIDFTQKKYGEAIENYKEALRLNPEDEHARKNLRIAQLQKQDNDQQQQQQQQDQQQQQQQQEDRQNINEQTSEQILNAAERKESLKRSQMQERGESTEKSGRSTKRW